MFLFIDPSVNGKLSLILATPQRRISHVTYNISGHHSKSILSCVVKFMKRVDDSLVALDGLIVINGTGSFTTTRLTVSVVNTIGWLYDLPIYSFPATKEIFTFLYEPFGRLEKATFFAPFRSVGPVRGSTLRVGSRRKFRNFIKQVYSRRPNITVKKL